MASTKYQTSLDDIAVLMGVTVRVAPVPPRQWGIYDHPHRLITMKPGLSPAQYRSTLAHELGHAYYGHHGHGNRKQEKQADIWAAKQLISLESLIANSECTLDVGEVAANLDVMPNVVRDFVSTLNELEIAAVLGMLKEAST